MKCLSTPLVTNPLSAVSFSIVSESVNSRLKTSTYHAYVPVARSSSQVTSFCRDVCVKLQACPCLFGPEETVTCPNDCQNVDKSTFRK